MYAVMRDLGLVGSLPRDHPALHRDLDAVLGLPLHGFMRGAAEGVRGGSRVDGASSLRTFRRVVFPLLRPVTGTVAIFTGLIIWNDFFLSLIFLNGTDKTPLPVAVYTFVGAFASRWNLIFAAVIVSLLPDHDLLPLRAAPADPRVHRRHQDLGEPDGNRHLLERRQDLPRRHARRRGPQPRDRRRRVRRLRRPVGLRQDDRAADGRGARGHHRAASSGSATTSSTTSRRSSATSRWSSRTTRSIRT